MAWSRFIQQHARFILGFGLLLALLCLAYARTRLHFSNDRTRMLDPKHPAQSRFEEFRGRFGADPEVVILVTSLDEKLRQHAVDALVEELASETKLKQLSGALDLPLLPQQGLYYVSAQRLNELEQRLATQKSYAAGAFFAADSTALPQDPKVLEQLVQALKSRGREPYQSPFGPSPPRLTSRLYLELAPNTAVVVARVAESDESLLDRLRQSVLRVAHQHAGVEIDLGGDFVAFTDDARSARRTALQVSLISLVLVHAFFRWAFGRPQPPRMALLTVLVGLAWSCAWVAWATPTLNLITINFTATLIGLGMDFNIQLLYRYQEQLRTQEPSLALARTLATAGRENLVGALATSAAFFSLTATPFLGVAQLGLISGVGVLLCWVASMTILPCLLVLFPTPPGPSGEGRLAHWERSWRARPGAVLGLALLVTAVALAYVQKPRFDYNLLHMMPLQAAAISFDQEFHQRCGMCSLYAVSLASSEAEMRSRVEQFRQLPSVARVESPADWIPPQPQHRRAQVERLLKNVGATPPLWRPQARLSTAQLLRLRDGFQGNQPQLSRLLQDLGPGPIQDGLSYFFVELHGDLDRRLTWLRQQKSDPVPSWDQIPAPLMTRYRHGQEWLIKVYPKSDIWEKEPLQQFLGETHSVDPQITGLPLLTYTYLEQLRSSYWVAGRNALVAICLILVISFRRLDRALWALAPKLLGVIWMLGAMGLLGVDFNPANATALPLTLGIGLVFGVHVVHQRCEQGGGVFAGSTGNAVMVSGVSTVLGYLSLLSSPYRGIASLGLVMGLGIVSSLLASLVVLPVALDVLERVRTRS